MSIARHASVRAAAAVAVTVTVTLGLGGSKAAWAQIEVRPAAVDAARCMVATDAKRPVPEYPFEAYKGRKPGRVKAALRFTAPDRAPRVEILQAEGEGDFAEAVREWARTLRAPCLTEGEAVVTQEYVFRDHEQPVAYGPPVDETLRRSRELVGCMVHRFPGRIPEYPEAALRAGIQGRLYARMRFDAPDRAPEVTVSHRRTATPLAATVRDWAEGFRMPCFRPGIDQPTEGRAVFIFVLAGQAYGFRPMTLMQLLPSVKGIRQQRLQLDTFTMGCPFDLQLLYLRPGLPNRVGQVGEYRPEREPLLQWLRDVELDMPPRSLDAVFADTADITVPCVNIDLDPLAPKEKTP